MKKILFFSIILFATACNLTKDVDIDLPEYERQPVVECYLEPGKPFRLLLTRSYAFFDPLGIDSSFFEKTLLQGATVTITYEGQTITIPNLPSLEANPVKLYNYTSALLVPATPGIEYTLNIELPDNGGNITAKTTMLPPVPIDSVVVEWNTDTDSLARVLTYFTDDLAKENFYRRLLNYSSLDSFPQQDFITNDRLNTTAKVAFGTAYELEKGDTVFNAVYHIERPYYDYLESIQLSILANLNPFAQPSRIKSNVSGNSNPLGIFTCLVFDRDTTVIQ
jgi:hypothetical protein